ncbi:hypothetical protein JCGZ_11924 [Jatropha curcas]|uniref:AAR2 N-terminal domain-containing protein n=1 Tax=Jatropha curcas TaxID=180498 RepID=A0A067KHG3_JATCU|nr:hypothetical protein JCGZ_11924 [Jatropha curcas]
MDPETALEYVKQGATLLLLDVPQYTLVGIDTQLFTVGPAFKGIKMIPPGPHFVFYSSSSRFVCVVISQGNLKLLITEFNFTGLFASITLNCMKFV